MAGISGRHDFGDELVRQEVLTREELDAIMEQEAVSGVPWYRQLLQKEIISVGALEDLFRFEYHSKAKRQLDESIGATLVKMGEISKDDLKAALAEQKRTGRLLGKILLDSGVVKPEALAKALAKQHKTAIINELTGGPTGSLVPLPSNLAESLLVCGYVAPSWTPASRRGP